MLRDVCSLIDRGSGCWKGGHALLIMASYLHVYALGHLLEGILSLGVGPATVNRATHEAALVCHSISGLHMMDRPTDTLVRLQSWLRETHTFPTNQLQ
jgi:hypothetical protein